MEQLQEQQEIKLISMDMIQSQQVEWLWYPYIPFGKITIVQGDPGEGKTTFALNLAPCWTAWSLSATPSNFRLTDFLRPAHARC